MPRTFKSSIAPWASPNQNQDKTINKNQKNFPELPNNVTLNNRNYQQNIENNHSNFHKFSKDQKDFSEIPEIGKTLELFGKLVNELKSTLDHGARLAIMMQYCCPNNVS